MGQKVGLIAAKTSVASFREAFHRAWPELHVVAERQVADLDSGLKWSSEQEKFVSANDWTRDNPGRKSYFLWRDGDWVVLDDISFVLPVREDELKRLSAELGRVVTVIVASNSGSAGFSVYERGSLRRNVFASDGEIVESTGDPVLEERGLSADRFDSEDAENVASAFGLTSLFPAPVELTVLIIEDRKDYSEFLGREAQTSTVQSSSGSALMQPSPPSKQTTLRVQQPKTVLKPWWKFW